MIFNDDCMNVLKNIPDKSIDLIITDPPYEFVGHGGGGEFGINKRKYHTELEDVKITKGFSPEIMTEFIRVMKKINIYIFCNKEQIIKYINFFAGYNFDLLTWHKTNPVPTCSNKYLSDTEYLLFFREKGVKVYGEYKTKRKYYVTPVNKEDKKLYNHPTVKPLEIIKNLVINSSLENDIILDPFAGSGTTGVACKELKRRFIGCEINKEFYKTAVDRINKTSYGDSKNV